VHLNPLTSPVAAAAVAAAAVPMKSLSLLLSPAAVRALAAMSR
jgi:hypothetical protein